MKKKIAALLVATMACASLAGCGTSTTSTSDVEFPGTPVDYKSLEITDVELIEVTDEDIQTAIDSIIESNMLYSEVTDRGIEEGDTVNIDYIGYLDGVAFENGTATNQELVIGSETYIDGFESGLIGYYAGDTVDLDLTFDDDYYSEDLAGQTVVFTVIINSVYTTMLSEWNDEFVQNISDTCTTVEEYEAELRVAYEEENLATQIDAKKSLIWTAIIEGSEVDEYPEDEINETMDYLFELYEYYASWYSMDITEYIALYDMTEEEYNETVEQAAQQTYVSDQIIPYIASVEGLTPTDDEYQVEIDAILTMYGYTDEDSFYTDYQVTREDLELEILSDVVLDWLVENVTYVEATE